MVRGCDDFNLLDLKTGDVCAANATNTNFAERDFEIVVKIPAQPARDIVYVR